MLAKRIIPCLDVKDRLVVKGRQFNDLVLAGDPVQLAEQYYIQGADEIAFLDITASIEKRKTIIDVVRKVAKRIFIPLLVGGGISSLDDIRQLLNAGADKVSLNTSAVENPMLIKQAADRFGSQCIVIAIDAKRCNSNWQVFVKGGAQPTGLDAFEWAKKVESLGAGEILLTSMDRDGTREGFDLGLTRRISQSASIPVIASGGGGELDSFYQVLTDGYADAVLAASVFHFSRYAVSEVKQYLNAKNVRMRT